jgi:hypothetical protein
MTFEVPILPVPADVMLAMSDPQRFVGGGKHGSSRHKFLKAEDDMLRELVEKYGESNWTIIARYMRRRTARQCRERYKNYLSPKVRNRDWTEDEEELLAQKVREFGPKWAKIAVFFESRSDVNVKNHWAALMSRNKRVQKYSMARARQEESGMVGMEYLDDDEDGRKEDEWEDGWAPNRSGEGDNLEEEDSSSYFE